MEITLQVIISCVLEVLDPSSRDVHLVPEFHLFGSLNSFQFVLLVGSLEEKLGLEFEQSDLTDRKNWETPNAIAALVKRMGASKAA